MMTMIKMMLSKRLMAEMKLPLVDLAVLVKKSCLMKQNKMETMLIMKVIDINQINNLFLTLQIEDLQRKKMKDKESCHPLPKISMLI
jgi:phage-related baseplate assembly protein